MYIKAFMLYPRASGFRAHHQSTFFHHSFSARQVASFHTILTSRFSIILSNQHQGNLRQSLQCTNQSDCVEINYQYPRKLKSYAEFCMTKSIFKISVMNLIYQPVQFELGRKILTKSSLTVSKQAKRE